MGISISHKTHEKIEANRQLGRLCAGGHHYCIHPATTRVSTSRWLSVIDEGPVTESVLIFCTRHANEFPVGYRGRNFIVTDSVRIA